MRIRPKKLSHIIITACLCLLILACSKVSQQNFDKIKDNMTMKQVVALIGEPTTTESISIAGISGTSAVWKNKDAEIDIQFLNNQVVVKSFSKPMEQPSDADKPIKQR